MSLEASAGTALLSYSGLALAPGSKPASGVIRAGEILGLAGLEGHGQDEFLHVLAGLAPAQSGSVWIGAQGSGTPVRNYRQVMRSGVGYLPRDRRTTGIFPVLSVLDNFGLPSMSTFSRFGVLKRKAQRARLKEFTDFLSIRYPDMNAPITALSGGNQQKILLARWLARDPKVLLLNDPTRGVDLNTRLKFYQAFKDLAGSSGLALVILSSEIEEIIEICDRVMVFRDFEVTASLARSEMTTERVLAAMFGQEVES